MAADSSVLLGVMPKQYPLLAGAAALLLYWRACMLDATLLAYMIVHTTCPASGVGLVHVVPPMEGCVLYTCTRVNVRLKTC